MATVSGRNGKNRKGMGVSIYMSSRAEDLLERVALAMGRSRSEIVSLLIETYGPQLLTDSRGGK